MQFPLLQDLAIILATAGGVTLLFHRIKQPVVLGYIIAGVIVGPNTGRFPMVTDRHAVETLSELGVILLMFGLGLHFSLRKLLSVGPTAVIAAVLEIAVMFLGGYWVGKAFGWNAMDCIFLGAILSISSTTIILKALQELKLTKASFAAKVFGILIVEDILAIAMIALLSGIATTGSVNSGDVLLTLGKLGVFLAVVLVAGLLLVPGLIRYVNGFKSGEMLLIVALALCFGVSYVALWLGYSVALGAFLIGAVIAETREHGKVEALVEPVRDMFAAVFFVSIGMLIDPQMLLAYAGPIVIITLVVVFGKVLACGIGAFVAGNDRTTSLRIGMSLAQIGEFSFIIATLGLQTKVTSSFLYPLAVAVSAITTLLTPYLLKGSEGTARWVERHSPRRLVAYLDEYGRWVGRMGRSAGTMPRVRKLFIRWGLQLALNMLLLTGILIAAAWVGTLESVRGFAFPAWTGGPKAVVWLSGTLVALPVLVAIMRKMRVVAMAVAELSVSRAAAGEKTAAARSVVATVLLSLGLGCVVLWGLALTSAILPPWPVLLTLVLIAGVIAAVMWRSLVRVYAQAQIRLAETMAEQEVAAEPVAAEPMALLKGAEMRAITLEAGSSALGRLIRELQLRTATGASVVAIDRSDDPIINPGPDEELRAGDRVYLLGTAQQIERAVAALTPREKAR